jgi:hypothetical protein
MGAPMEQFSSEQIGALLFFALFGSPGLLLLLFARHYRDWNVRELQRERAVVIFRLLGGFFFVLAAVLAGLAVMDRMPH